VYVPTIVSTVNCGVASAGVTYSAPDERLHLSRRPLTRRDGAVVLPERGLLDANEFVVPQGIRLGKTVPEVSALVNMSRAAAVIAARALGNGAVPGRRPA
jgi:hypothetical protein